MRARGVRHALHVGLLAGRPPAMSSSGNHHKSSELPTLKPVNLVARMVRNSSPQGGMVYEPFSGSSRTMVACESWSRVWRAIELYPKEVAVALERMADANCHGERRKA